jgi:hypothetical protein
MKITKKMVMMEVPRKFRLFRTLEFTFKTVRVPMPSLLLLKPFYPACLYLFPMHMPRCLQRLPCWKMEGGASSLF